MAVTATEKVFNHGIGRGLFFPITNGTHGSAVEVKGLTAQSEDPNAESTNIWADMEGVAFFTQQGAVTRSTEITALEYPKEMKTHALGKKEVGFGLVNDPKAYRQFGIVFGEWRNVAGKEILEVNVYYALTASPASVERKADEDSLEATEKKITCSVNNFEPAGTDFFSFTVDPDDPADENLWALEKMYNTGSIVLPTDVKPEV